MTWINSHLERKGKNIRKKIRNLLSRSETGRVTTKARTDGTRPYSCTKKRQTQDKQTRHTVKADGSTSPKEEEIEESIKKVPEEDDKEEPFQPTKPVLCRRTSVLYYASERRRLCFLGMWYIHTLCRPINIRTTTTKPYDSLCNMISESRQCNGPCLLGM